MNFKKGDKVRLARATSGTHYFSGDEVKLPPGKEGEVVCLDPLPSGDRRLFVMVVVFKGPECKAMPRMNDVIAEFHAGTIEALERA